ncbi:hypothetical protein NL517_29470, partial [Klebsiella pneumoniae]|nr:hypothetical protein [Klebsiella pneumoniae]
QQKRIASEFSQWLTNKAEVKASVRPQPGQNIIHLGATEQSFAISGSATLSPTGLGDVRSDSLHMNMGLSDPESTRQLLTWFDNVWADAQNF